MPQARLSDLLKYIRNIGAEDQEDDESIQDLCKPKYEEAKKEIPKVSTILFPILKNTFVPELQKLVEKKNKK